MEVLLLIERWVEESRKLQMVAQSIAMNAIRTLFRVKNVQLVATCALIGFMVDVLTSQNSKLMFSLAYLDGNGSVLHVYRLTLKPFQEDKSRQEVKNLESQISTTENSLKKLKISIFTYFLC